MTTLRLNLLLVIYSDIEKESVYFPYNTAPALHCSISIPVGSQASRCLPASVAVARSVLVR